jgi:hypothetical protein
MKVYVSKQIYAYFRSQTGRIDLQMIQYLPQAFDGKAFNFTQALRQRLVAEGIGTE